MEDEFLVRIAAVSFLEDAGFSVIESDNADDAIRLLESRDDIRVLFTDIDMPAGSMNGLKLAKAVTLRWPPVKIIIVSGHCVPTKQEMPAESKFFAKPYEQSKVISTMREMLEAA